MNYCGSPLSFTGTTNVMCQIVTVTLIKIIPLVCIQSGKVKSDEDSKEDEVEIIGTFHPDDIKIKYELVNI